METKDAKLSFEDALAQLETIVESMESGEVPLAELLAKFEQGTKLLKVCEARLKDAELKIEQLKKQKDGTVTLEKFETEREANKMAREMRETNPGATVKQGVLSEQAYRLFSGVSPDTLELFADSIGASENSGVANTFQTT